jgi:hypothetical protein
VTLADEYRTINDVIGPFGMWWMSSQMKVGVVIGSKELGNFVKNETPALLRRNVNIYFYVYTNIQQLNASHEPIKLYKVTKHEGGGGLRETRSQRAILE